VGKKEREKRKTEEKKGNKERERGVCVRLQQRERER
jgi:hypothetical protein